MVVVSLSNLATEANVRLVKTRVEAYVASSSYGFADYPQSRALSRLSFILASQDFPIVNELHLEWWRDIMSKKPFAIEAGEKPYFDGALHSRTRFSD